MILTSSPVVRPPRPWAPMPNWLTLSNSSRRSSSMRFCGPRAFSSWMSMDSISTSLAITAAFSAVPPMPMPSMPGGHQPAPISGTVLSTQSTIESDRLSMAHFHFVAGDGGVVDPGGGVVFGVLARAGRVGQDRGAEYVFRQVVGAAYAFVDHVVDAHGRAVPAHVHADADKYGDDAGVLADRPVAGGAHARVDQDLRHGVLGCWRFFAQVGLMHGLDKIHGVVIGDELQGVGDALDQVVLLDHGHAGRSFLKG